MDCYGLRRNETRTRIYEALYVWGGCYEFRDRKMKGGVTDE